MLQPKLTSRLVTIILEIACGAQIVPLSNVKALSPPPNTVSTVQLHRFLNKTAHHYFSTDSSEADAFSKPGKSGKYEGPKGWVLTQKISGDTVPVYALHQGDEPFRYSHFYTTDMNEANNA